MKIAHINPGVRGVANYALNIYNYFKNKEGIENLIISCSKWRKQAIPVFEPKSKLIANIYPYTIRIKEVEQRLAEFAPDIIHYHYVAGRLDFYAKKFQKEFRTPMISTVHMSVDSKKFIFDRAIRQYFLMTRKYFKHVNVYVAISKFVKNQLENISGVPKERIVLLYAGVDTEIFKPLPREKHDTLEICFVGQIMPEKGIDILIKSVVELKKVRKVRLSIIGEGHLKKLLQEKTKNNPEIQWVGYLKDPKKISEYYAKSDVVVLPNRWDEAFSYIPLEAMACGTAVIAARVGGNAEAILEGKTGFLFDREREDQLYELLKNCEAEKLWEIGSKGRERVLKNFTLQLFGQKYQ